MNTKEKLNEKYDLCSLNFTNLFHSIEIARSDFYNHAKETVYETYLTELWDEKQKGNKICGHKGIINGQHISGHTNAYNCNTSYLQNLNLTTFATTFSFPSFSFPLHLQKHELALNLHYLLHLGVPLALESYLLRAAVLIFLNRNWQSFII